jgi:ribosomal protein S6--L-glutamate ligase
MVVSFHPLFRADRNILCAGRDPGPAELSAIREAHAVILPQGCSRKLYFLARNNCPNIFPNYDARFEYPGKTGQIRLFREKSIPHPQTEIFNRVDEYKRSYSGAIAPAIPLVFKLDWGGEGDTVFLVQSPSELEACLERSAKYEASGQFGFIIQKFIPSGNRSLRVAVIGDGMTSYWRTGSDQSGFLSSLSKGGHIDPSGDPDLKKEGEKLVAEACRRASINLAGMDVIFAEGESAPQPLMLEINYFFGRVGLGGSEEYYRMLKTAIKRWVKSLK